MQEESTPVRNKLLDLYHTKTTVPNLHRKLKKFNNRLLFSNEGIAKRSLGKSADSALMHQWTFNVHERKNTLSHLASSPNVTQWKAHHLPRIQYHHCIPWIDSDWENRRNAGLHFMYCLQETSCSRPRVVSGTTRLIRTCPTNKREWRRIQLRRTPVVLGNRTRLPSARTSVCKPARGITSWSPALRWHHHPQLAFPQNQNQFFVGLNMSERFRLKQKDKTGHVLLLSLSLSSLCICLCLSLSACSPIFWKTHERFSSGRFAVPVRYFSPSRLRHHERVHLALRQPLAQVSVVRRQQQKLHLLCDGYVTTH